MIETMGNPPARSVNPPAKLCRRWLNPRSPRVCATRPWSAINFNPNGPQIECSKLSCNSNRLEADPRRTLFVGQYVSLLLFGLLNPVLKTARALCAASHFERLQAESQGPPVSLAS